MPRLESLPQIQRTMLVTRAVEINDGAPHTPLPRPLSECSLAVVTSAGIHRRGDEPFGREDPTFRVIPADSEPADILQSHSSLAFDKTAFIRDINVVFPLDRVRELVADGRVGRLGPNHYSFMGALPDLSRVQNETAAEVGRRLVDEGVEVVLLTPT
jgi:D-proline reductase (dithiol) PrdB